MQIVDLMINEHGDKAISGGNPVLMQEFGYLAEHAEQADIYQLWVDTPYAKG
jgi:hypothetical protein